MKMPRRWRHWGASPTRDECHVNGDENVTFPETSRLWCGHFPEDECPCSPGGDEDEDMYAERASDEHPDPMDDDNWRTPLSEQIRMYGEEVEAVLDEHVRLLLDPWYRREVIMAGARRLIDGFVEYGDAAYRWGADERDRNMIEEDADWTVYGTTGDFTPAP